MQCLHQYRGQYKACNVNAAQGVSIELVRLCWMDFHFNFYWVTGCLWQGEDSQGWRDQRSMSAYSWRTLGCTGPRAQVTPFPTFFSSLGLGDIITLDMVSFVHHWCGWGWIRFFSCIHMWDSLSMFNVQHLFRRNCNPTTPSHLSLMYSAFLQVWYPVFSTTAQPPPSPYSQHPAVFPTRLHVSGASGINIDCLSRPCGCRWTLSKPGSQCYIEVSLTWHFHFDKLNGGEHKG